MSDQLPERVVGVAVGMAPMEIIGPGGQKMTSVASRILAVCESGRCFALVQNPLDQSAEVWKEFAAIPDSAEAKRLAFTAALSPMIPPSSGPAS